VVVPDDLGARLPAPEKVWLEGAPKIDGSGAGAERHDSSVVHGGGETTAGKPPFTRAS
jgi:hypothetical protein